MVTRYSAKRAKPAVECGSRATALTERAGGNRRKQVDALKLKGGSSATALQGEARK